MGAGLQPGGALSKRRARRRSAAPMSEINVTPMVDVMLVLLIIFMVTAPLLTVGVDVEFEGGPCPRSSCRRPRPARSSRSRRR